MKVNRTNTEKFDKCCLYSLEHHCTTVQCFFIMDYVKLHLICSKYQLASDVPVKDECALPGLIERSLSLVGLAHLSLGYHTSQLKHAANHK